MGKFFMLPGHIEREFDEKRCLMVKKHKHIRCIGYCRCSTVEQATEGMSLEVQRSKIEAYCSLNDLELVDIVEDAGISGKSLNRPGIQSVLERLHNDEVDAIIVLKLDRLSRSTRDVLHMTELAQANDWQLHSISEKLDTSTASGRFVVSILAALGQMEREQIGERTSLALQHKKNNGDTLGTTPLGFDTSTSDGGQRVLVPNMEEQEILVRVKEMRDSGMSYGLIAEELNSSSVPTKRGGRWYGSTVRYLIQKVIPMALFV